MVKFCFHRSLSFIFSATSPKVALSVFPLALKKPPVNPLSQHSIKVAFLHMSSPLDGKYFESIIFPSLNKISVIYNGIEKNHTIIKDK